MKQQQKPSAKRPRDVSAGWVDELIEPLRADLAILQGVGDTLRSHASGTAEVLGADVRAALRQLRADVRTTQAQIDVALAYDRDEYVAAMRGLVEAWRERVDALQVQAELARMDVRDELQPVIVAAQNAAARLRADLEAAAADVNATVDTLALTLQDATAELASVARSVARVTSQAITQR